MVLGELGIAALVIHRGLVLITIFHDGAGETDGEVGVIGAGPSVGDAVAGDKGGAFHLYFGPQGFAVIIVDAVVQVQDDVPLLPGREGVAVHAHPLRSRQFHPDAAVLKLHLVVTGSGRFLCMAEALAVSFFRILGRAGREMDFSRSGHEQDVSQV